MNLTGTSRMHAMREEAWPIFVISLHDAHERRRSIREQCAELGLEFEFFDAIDGRTGLPKEFEAEIDREAARARHQRPLADVEFACALSHRRVYQRVLEHGLPGAVVLEDDVILGPQFARFIAGRGYGSADFIQMGYGPARIFRFRIRRWSAEISVAPLAANASSTMAYSISNRGSEYVLSRSVRVAGIADWPVDMVPLAPLVTLPMIVAHPPRSAANSYIEAGRAPIEEKYRAHIEHSRPVHSTAKRRSLTRFGRGDYWRRWWLKRRTRWVAGVEQR